MAGVVVAVQLEGALPLGEVGPEVVGPEVERALTTISEGDESAVWTFARKKRLGPFRVADREAHRQKDLARLVRAGFSFRLSKLVISTAAGR